MARKTILVCGSLGFLMSNFIRYLIYRTKDYDIISIDKISGETHAKRRYINRAHQFYIGDITDVDLMHKLTWLHNIDIIINGVNSLFPDPNTIVLGAKNLVELGKPVIQLTPCIWEQDPNGWWNAAAMTINNAGGKVLEIPNCLGIRQKATDGAAKIIKGILDYGEVHVSKKKIPWAHSEDVSSVLWFMIEKMLNGEKVPNHIKCPIIGLMSTEDIAKQAITLFDQESKINLSEDVDVCTSFESSILEGWGSDIKGISEATERVLGWYKSNKWALCL